MSQPPVTGTKKRRYFLSFFGVQANGQGIFHTADIERELPICSVTDVTDVQTTIAQAGGFVHVALINWRLFEEPGVLIAL